MSEERRRTLEKYIHTNCCSDECGWFAFFTPSGTIGFDLPDYRVNGRETEEEAIQALVEMAVKAITESAELARLREQKAKLEKKLDKESLLIGMCISHGFVTESQLKEFERVLEQVYSKQAIESEGK